MKLLKQLAISGLTISFFAVVACDQKLKEHPISPQVKQQMDARKKVADSAQSISGTINFDESIVSKVPKQGTLFLIARPEGVLIGHL